MDWLDLLAVQGTLSTAKKKIRFRNKVHEGLPRAGGQERPWNGYLFPDTSLTLGFKLVSLTLTNHLASGVPLWTHNRAPQRKQNFSEIQRLSRLSTLKTYWKTRHVSQLFCPLHASTLRPEAAQTQITPWVGSATSGKPSSQRAHVHGHQSSFLLGEVKTTLICWVAKHSISHM